MRLAFLFRQRRLMQFDPAFKSSSTPSSTQLSLSAPSSVKRTYSQEALATATQTSHPEHFKVPRVGNSQQSFSSIRRSSAAPLQELVISKPQTKAQQKLRPSRGVLSVPHKEGQASSSKVPSLPKKVTKQTRGGKSRIRLTVIEGPLHDEAYINREHNKSPIPLKKIHLETPKSSIGNFSVIATGSPPKYVSVEGQLSNGTLLFRTTVTVSINPVIIGIGDHTTKKESEKLAALAAVYQLQELGLLENPTKLLPQEKVSVKLSDGSNVQYERARSFMDYYCRRYKFPQPLINFVDVKNGRAWEAVMSVDNRRIGLGSGNSKKSAQIACYLDVTQYLESCDPELWQEYAKASKTGADLGLAPKVWLQMSDGLNDDIRDLCVDIRKSHLYQNRPHNGSVAAEQPSNHITHGSRFRSSPLALAQKSFQLQTERKQYLEDPKMERMRNTRMALPVSTRAESVMQHINHHDVTICMAATGSGKTTQIPQLILDEYIDQGQGAHCNVVVTQPRRLAAISVADRVAKERGQTLGKSVGYQVRFDHRLPEEHGSITFCTTGIFLKRMQSALLADHTSARNLDDVTHIVVDEVHERDVDTDLLLVVLKRLLADRKARNKPLKIILMSATINPTLFQQYFANEFGQPADVIEVPGRSFPVTKYFLDDFVPKLLNGPTRWIMGDDSVVKYLAKELSPVIGQSLGLLQNRVAPEGEELDLPIPLIAATISHVLQTSDDGHVLVFLPGWEDIISLQRLLLQPAGPLGVKISDTSKFSIHLLHSSIPLAEQQVIFDPSPNGIRRIILATNIAETSITIPDVVYVVDTAKIKEQQYDPDRHMSSLVSAWVGSSNLNQRAGRAGRHRSGEYFGIIGKEHAEALHPYQTVEMKRVDLSNIVMHVKALNFPGMSVEEVLAATIEPPAIERVIAASKELQMVGALDADKNLTSLGRVLLQLPVEAQMGRLVLYGSFFRCLDQALTLAAILTNRDPFMSPMQYKREAAARKDSWCPPEFRSDALAVLRAYNAWWAMQSRSQFSAANSFCNENFLSRPTMLMIQKIKTQLLESLHRAGVIDVSAGGMTDARGLGYTPAELNVNGNSLPLLAGLIAIASQPKFAIQTSEASFRTSIDKFTMIHPTSVNYRKRNAPPSDIQSPGEKQIYAFADKRKNVTAANSPTFLVTTTRLDPMTYLLFGAYNIEVTERGLECDNWLPVVGNLDALDDIQRLKILMEACMLRVFEGIVMSHGNKRLTQPIQSREDEIEDHRAKTSLSKEEMKELDLMTRDVVNILNRFSDERIATQSRSNSRPATPMGTPVGSPSSQPSRLPTMPGGPRSGYSTPNYQSRPSTPSRLSRRLY